MKLIVISDAHGRPLWKEIIKQNRDADRFVFLGDYFDSFTIHANEQLLNFQEIITFKEKNEDKVILLTGNHEMHYLPHFLQNGEHYSGFQHARSIDISLLLQANLPKLQMAYQHNNILFTHAGVTYTWLNDHGFDNKQDVVEFINDLFRYTPGSFAFTGMDPYGDSIHSSPVWVRPRSLMSNAYQFDQIIQVVGHTEHRNITVIKNRFYFTDAPESREYLVIIDGEFTILLGEHTIST